MSIASQNSGRVSHPVLLATHTISRSTRNGGRGHIHNPICESPDWTVWMRLSALTWGACLITFEQQQNSISSKEKHKREGRVWEES
jgi:hypothetical protein